MLPMAVVLGGNLVQTGGVFGAGFVGWVGFDPWFGFVGFVEPIPGPFCNLLVMRLPPLLAFLVVPFAWTALAVRLTLTIVAKTVVELRMRIMALFFRGLELRWCLRCSTPL